MLRWLNTGFEVEWIEEDILRRNITIKDCAGTSEAVPISVVEGAKKNTKHLAQKCIEGFAAHGLYLCEKACEALGSGGKIYKDKCNEYKVYFK